MAVTIRDVAKAAGVSISTVSRALARPEQVAAATRHRVEEAVHALGYRPSVAARGLVTGRTGNIGLLVPDLENPYFGSVCKGVQERARAGGYNVFIADSNEDTALEGEILASMAGQVDGMILCSPRSSDGQLQRLGGHKVLVDRRMDGVASIAGDHAGGMRQILGHLAALGHTRIAYAGGPAGSWSNGEREAALEGASAASAGLDVIRLGNFPSSFTGGIQAGDFAIASGATAVVAFNDLVAVGLLERLQQRGVTVPAQVSVASFDNVPVATLVRPSLTTVDCPRIQMGRNSVDMLLDAVAGRGESAAVTVESELIVRQSTGIVPPGLPGA